MEQEALRIRKELQRWEKQFKQSNDGRKPSKDDIDHHPLIAEKYKLYRELRKQEPAMPANASVTPRKSITTDTMMHVKAMALEETVVEASPNVDRNHQSKLFSASFLAAPPLIIEARENCKPSNSVEIQAFGKELNKKSTRTIIKVRKDVSPKEDVVFDLDDRHISTPVKPLKTLHKPNLTAALPSSKIMDNQDKTPVKSPSKFSWAFAKVNRGMISRNNHTVDLFSPQIRPGQALSSRIRQSSSLFASARKKRAFLFSPAKKMESTETLIELEDTDDPFLDNNTGEASVDVLESSARDSHETESGTVNLPPKHSDDEEFDEIQGSENKNAVKRKRRPILGKRQTSKKKLKPVTDPDSAKPRPTKRRKMSTTKSTAHGVVMKLNRKGKKNVFINHSIVDRKGPLNSQYFNAEQVDAGDNPFTEITGQDFQDENHKEPNTSSESEDNEAENFDTDDSIDVILRDIFGFENFQTGQRVVIERILRNQSTIFISPTGGGKSLCYQLASFIFGRKDQELTLVISPTVSLMQDQLQQLPKSIRGACWSSNLSNVERRQLMSDLTEKRIDVLFVSPERLTSSAFLSFFALPTSPKVRLVCIDEVHCLSEWSHNFRPAYLLINHVVREQLGATCILGLTATATKDAQKSICRSLGLNFETDVIMNPLVRDNLKISVSFEHKKKQALGELLLSTPFSTINSIIIYCMRQSETDEVALYLRTAFKKNAESYHAGKEASERTRVQKAFISGKLSIICATIAFGLGINKKDVRAVIHYSMPKSLENYLQEIGRAGRDGLDAYCHLFLAESDYFRLRSLAFSDSVDRILVKRFLEKVFLANNSTNGANGEKKQPEKLRMIEVEPLEKELDTKKPVMSTMMSYLHLDSKKSIKMMPTAHMTYTLIFYNQSASAVADNNEFMDKIFKELFDLGNNSYRIDTVTVCNDLKISPQELGEQLYSLQAQKLLQIRPEKETICYEIMREVENNPQLFMELWTDLTEYMAKIETVTLQKVDQIFALMKAAGTDMFQNDHLPDGVHTEPTLQSTDVNLIKQCIEEYFGSVDTTNTGKIGQLVETGNHLADSIKCRVSVVEQDLKNFIYMNSNRQLSGRMIARIFHALPSPQLAHREWSRNQYWGKHMNFDFKTLFNLANQCLISYNEGTL